MKVFTALALLVIMACMTIDQGQFQTISSQDEWPELEDFRIMIAITFPPSEKGDLSVLKGQSGELLAVAIKLSKSAVPERFNTPKIRRALSDLVLGSEKVNEYVKTKQTDKVLKDQISNVHDAFHEIIYSCNEIN